MDKNHTKVESNIESGRPAGPVSDAGLDAYMDHKLPSNSIKQSIAKLDHMNLDEKMNLTSAQSTTLRTLEAALLKGDVKQAQSTIASFQKDPDALTPIADVLAKDLKAAGIKLEYEVNLPTIGPNDKDGNPTSLRSGMFWLSDAMTPEDHVRKTTTDMCLYTAAGDHGYGNLNTPRSTTEFISPISNTISKAEAFSKLSGVARLNLEQQ